MFYIYLFVIIFVICVAFSIIAEVDPDEGLFGSGLVAAMLCAFVWATRGMINLANDDHAKTAAAEVAAPPPQEKNSTEPAAPAAGGW
jgi:hypothetical protein